jgi:hypothetical protein
MRTNTDKRNFKWNPNGICIWGGWYKPSSSCLFDYWSVYHAYFTAMGYIILHHYLNIDNIESAIILTIILTLIHTKEEILGNTSLLSGEGIVIDNIGPIFDPKIKPELREYDNDYLDNSIGDVLSGLILCILIIIYWKAYNILPYWILYLFPLIIYMLLQKASMLYSK